MTILLLSPGLVSVLGRPEPSVVRSVSGTGPRWVTPTSRAHSRSLTGRPDRKVLQEVMLGVTEQRAEHLGSQGVLRVVLLLL
ncbi:jg19364 [Pararge aegeria aegeria]|uniref:Jg19364 protein n=1 Tax=Pararge aegeria aegeria TaxID=348720 RepID=A0A8S4R740_9NEOP|nr:jg19364 [Pararge aegeria aegeria]